MKFSYGIHAIVAATVIMASCRTTEPATDSTKLAESPTEVAGPRLCAAVRGNGHYIMSHFGALGRMTESFGIVDAMAGGSSATVTMFIYESILMNPLVRDAAPATRQQRVALLLKSTLGYLEAMKESPEANSIRLLYDVMATAQQKGLLELETTDHIATARALYELLSNSDIIDLINPRILQILVNADRLSPLKWQRQLSEVQLAASSILSFKADNQSIFFREGVIHFDGMANFIGRVADFYAGVSPVNLGNMRRFLDDCGSVSQGKDWTQFADAKVRTTTCGENFRNIVEEFRDKIRNGDLPTKPRVEQPIGVVLPSIVSTAVIADPASLKLFEASRKRYLAGKEPDLSIDFDKVKFGYFLPAVFEVRILEHKIAETSKDAKDRKFYSLGSGSSWRQALVTSPAEPGLSPAVMLKSGELSIGGWSDLAPVQILKYAGCEKIIYVTRRGEESNFLVSMKDEGRGVRRLGVAEQLNIKAIQRSAIYDLENNASSFSKALQKASSVWCTDWNRFTDSQIREMYQEAYASELVSRDSWMSERYDPAKITRAEITGCSVGSN